MVSIFYKCKHQTIKRFIQNIDCQLDAEKKEWI